jgi:hypothetical protein
MIMIGLTFALAMSMAAGKADPQDNARKEFFNCLVELSVENLDKDASASDYTKLAQEACADKKAVYFGIIAKAERAYSKPAEADKFASEEVQLIIDASTRDYGTFKQDKTRPVKEK